MRALSFTAGLLLMSCAAFAQTPCFSPISFSTASPLPPGVTGMPYSQDINVPHGDNCTLTWSLTSGALPPGLTLTSAGSGLNSKATITGTPASVGTFVFGITASQDLPAASVSKAFTLVVTAPLSISTASPLPSGMAGAAYSQRLAAAGGVPPYTWKLTSGTLPPLLIS